MISSKFCLDNAQQCFAFTPQANFPTHNLEFSLKVKVMGSNSGYLLKYFLLYIQFSTYLEVDVFQNSIRAVEFEEQHDKDAVVRHLLEIGLPYFMIDK